VETSNEDDETKEKQNEKELRISFDSLSVIGFAILNRGKQCPNKLSGKIAGDNWMMCSGCMKQYCFLCTSTFNGVQHFDKKCVRYTRINKISVKSVILFNIFTNTFFSIFVRSLMVLY